MRTGDLNSDITKHLGSDIWWKRMQGQSLCVCVCVHMHVHVVRCPLVSDTFKTSSKVWGLSSASCSKLNDENRSIRSEVMGKNVFGVFFANL